MDRIRQVNKPWWRRHLALCAGGAALAVLGAAAMRLPAAGYGIERGNAVIAAVQSGPLAVDVRGNGLLLPERISMVAAQSEGRVEQIKVRAGAAVAVGDVLVELSNPALQQSLEETRWALEAMLAEYNALKVSLANQRMNQKTTVVKAEFAYKAENMKLEAENNLIARHGMVIPEVDHRRVELNAQQLGQTWAIERERLQNFELDISAQLQAKDAQVEKLRKQLSRAQDQVAALQVRASLNGIVQALNLEIGQRLIAGATIAKLADPASLYAELKIPEQQARDLALGQSADIDTRNGHVRGEVRRVDPAVVNGMVKVDVHLVEALPKGARPDLSIDGSINISALNQAVFVQRPAQAQANTVANIYRLSDDNHAELTRVEFGIASVNQIEIKSGLNVGDRILLNDASNWGAAERVTLN